ncbi:MAG TPA: helix-turn-helix transcriptional regulator [Angustibacter sp.]|nr:helix-turn-helix transcriptional regulator [Angustibacter sp.]
MRARSPYDPPAPPGEVLRDARERAVLTQAQLAERAGVPAATVSRLETGARPARWDVLQRLCAALDLQPVLVTEPVDEHRRRRVGDQASLAPGEWFEDLVLDGVWALSLARGLQGAVDGTLAARLLGAPLPIADIELVVPWSVAADGDLGARSFDVAGLTLRPRGDADDGVWFYPSDERDIVVRAVDDLPPLTTVSTPVAASSPTPATVDVVAMHRLRLTVEEQRLFVHAVQWVADAR